MRTQRGFTIVELMIAVALVAIVTAVGVPSYQHVVRKAALSEVNQAFANISSRQIQYFNDARQYAGSLMKSSDLGGINLEADMAQRGYVCADNGANTGTVCRGKHFDVYFAALTERPVGSGWGAVAVPTSTGAFKSETFWYVRMPKNQNPYAVAARAGDPIEVLNTDAQDPHDWQRIPEPR
jgi:prepilin-type N-terminal cleavage/methylation domain-containing protein